MKKNESGFMLVETLIVSTLATTILVVLYLQFNNLVKNFNRELKYNSVSNLYALREMKKIVLNDNSGLFYSNLKDILNQNINDNKQSFLEINKDCSANTDVAYSLLNCTLVEKITSFYEINKIIFFTSTTNLNNTDFNIINSQNFENFINYIENKSTDKLDEDGSPIVEYSIAVEFSNNEYASINIGS